MTFFKSFLFLLCLGSSLAHSLVLEDLIHHSTGEITLKNKRIGYFVGSFDPLHKGQESVVASALEKGLCDYVIIYPAWGGDRYKVRSDVSIRLEMLFAVYADHPQVIVTALIPKELQQALTIPDPAKKKGDETFRKPAFEGTAFIGIMGTDTALYLAPNPETSHVYMTGLEISEEYCTHTWGSCMALPVDSFIVAIRKGEDISALKGMLRERPITAAFENRHAWAISSTEFKKILRSGQTVNSLVSEPVLHVIEKYDLYR